MFPGHVVSLRWNVGLPAWPTDLMNVCDIIMRHYHRKTFPVQLVPVENSISSNWNAFHGVFQTWVGQMHREWSCAVRRLWDKHFLNSLRKSFYTRILIRAMLHSVWSYREKVLSWEYQLTKCTTLIRYQYKYLIVFDMVYLHKGAMIFRWTMAVWLLRGVI